MDTKDKGKERSHILTLKVMRLTRPSSLQTQPGPVDGVECLKSVGSNPFADSWIDAKIDDSDKN
ncbi:unnamed protein product, partial [Notodromas monacha]